MLVVPHLRPPMMIRFGSAACLARRLGTRPPRFRSAVKRSRARRHIASSAESCVGAGMAGGTVPGEGFPSRVTAIRAAQCSGGIETYAGPGVDVFRTPDERFESLPGFGFEPHYAE